MGDDCHVQLNQLRFIQSPACILSIKETNAMKQNYFLSVHKFHEDSLAFQILLEKMEPTCSLDGWLGR